ncbi:MAG: helix-hairpin-helix domain-containing protein [Candidatus Brocadiia bacterium]
MAADKPDNDHVAGLLDRVADLLEMQDENPFRIRSYRRAANTVRAYDRPVAEFLDEGGEEALTELDGVGEGLAGAISEIVETGRLGLLDALESQLRPEQVLTKVPGVGEELAERIHEQLDVESLEELERAAHDGRLERVEGMGPKRVQGVRDALAGMLSRSAPRRSRQRREEEQPTEEPPIDLLLELDDEYRQKADAGELRTIAPRRFNPEGKSWLPIMHASRQGWDFTVLFSNTARAHELDKTHDWVVMYYEDGGVEDQCTVVTAGSGRLEGRRVVRGREGECRTYYESQEQS